MVLALRCLPTGWELYSAQCVEGMKCPVLGSDEIPQWVLASQQLEICRNVSKLFILFFSSRYKTLNTALRQSIMNHIYIMGFPVSCYFVFLSLTVFISSTLCYNQLHWNFIWCYRKIFNPNPFIISSTLVCNFKKAYILEHWKGWRGGDAPGRFLDKCSSWWSLLTKNSALPKRVPTQNLFWLGY